MGYAKYEEDIREIITERNYLSRDSIGEEPTYSKATYDVNTVPYIVPFERRAGKGDKLYERYVVCESCDNVFRYPVYFQKLVKRNDWEDPKKCSMCRMKKNASRNYCSEKNELLS